MSTQHKSMQHKRKSIATSGFTIIAFLIAFAVFVERLELHKLLGFDLAIIRTVQERIDNVNTRVMKWFTFLGSPPVVAVFVALSAIILYSKKMKREALFMVLANGLGAVFNEMLKYIFRRRRPTIHRLASASGYSFPSGHSMGSVMFYGTLSYLLCQRLKHRFAKVMTYVASSIMVLLTGISRIYLGVHYPSDVLSGYAAAGTWLSASTKAYSVIDEKHDA